MTDLDEKKALIRKVLDDKRADVVCADDVKYSDEVEHNEPLHALGYRLEMRHEDHCRMAIRFAYPVAAIHERLLDHQVTKDLRELSNAYNKEHDNA